MRASVCRGWMESETNVCLTCVVCVDRWMLRIATCPIITRARSSHASRHRLGGSRPARLCSLLLAYWNGAALRTGVLRL